MIFDAGYDPMRLACQLADLPVEILGRLRSDRVLHFPVPARQPGTNGRPPRHGRQFALSDPATWPEPAVTTTTATTRYGTAVARAWDRLHPRLTHRSAWISHDGPLPVIEGTLIRLQVDHLPGDRDPKPVWLWSSATGAAPAGVDQLWQAFLRRFDLEHTFRLYKQVLGWTTPKLRDPAAADRWTWLTITAHAQLRLARPLAADLRLPWERPAPPGRLTPARVRRGFQKHPRDGPLSSRCAQTRQTRTRAPARIEEPPPRTPPRRGENHHKTTQPQSTARTHRLNDKLIGSGPTASEGASTDPKAAYHAVSGSAERV